MADARSATTRHGSRGFMMSTSLFQIVPALVAAVRALTPRCLASCCRDLTASC